MWTKRELGSAAVAVAMLIAIAIMLVALAPHRAMANADIAKKTGLPCAKCHTAPPALNAYGQKYKDSHKK